MLNGFFKRQNNNFFQRCWAASFADAPSTKRRFPWRSRPKSRLSNWPGTRGPRTSTWLSISGLTKNTVFSFITRSRRKVSFPFPLKRLESKSGWLQPEFRSSKSTTLIRPTTMESGTRWSWLSPRITLWYFFNLQNYFNCNQFDTGNYLMWSLII